MVKRLATSPHDPLGITDSACKNQSVMVSVQYGPFNTYIPIRSTTIGISRVSRDPITMHTSWRSNSDITCVTSCSPYWGLTPRSLWGCCVCLPVRCSGFPGFAAGRGYDLTGGAPGGG
ncbi:homeobox protein LUMINIDEPENDENS [Dorcoceras hygrometricum]|uniref:Homeobox protein LUMINIDEPENDENS n=1 Tax=Dorcoceras hygrometricum TaxID=472368 RepID=A0A2Z7AJ99_9LAMI|nr:homeobox protein LUMINIDEPENDENS [Dorcoceras hygrometricum]